MASREENLRKLKESIKSTKLKLDIYLSDDKKFDPEIKDKVINAQSRAGDIFWLIEKCPVFLPPKQLPLLIEELRILDKALSLKDENLIKLNKLNEIQVSLTKINNFIGVDYEDYIYSKKTIEDISNLIDIISKLYADKNEDFPTLFKGLVIRVYENSQTTDNLRNKIVSDLINIHNLFYRSFYQSNVEIKNMFLYLQKMDIEINKNELEKNKAEFSNQVAQHNLEFKDVREKLGLQENEGIISSYKTESDKYKDEIGFYSGCITFTFITISSSILLKLLLSSFSHEWKSYIIFISFILSLTGLLAYFIKERARLVDLHTYCLKNYLELSALPKYMVELTTEQVQELRVDLAKTYFKGHTKNDEVDKDINNISQISSSIEQVAKSVIEIKNIVSK